MKMKERNPLRKKPQLQIFGNSNDAVDIVQKFTETVWKKFENIKELFYGTKRD